MWASTFLREVDQIINKKLDPEYFKFKFTNVCGNNLAMFLFFDQMQKKCNGDVEKIGKEAEFNDIVQRELIRNKKFIVLIMEKKSIGKQINETVKDFFK